MSIKVLVFESDGAFAGELRNELGKLGCAVRVVDDGNAGLQQAQTERPDLILLSIELPRMNGFSVCNKLKKDAELKDVPLIIMSSESSDETFEQHKKLRTRAEAYVHKPVAFGELLREINPFVALGGDALASSVDGDGEDVDSSAIVIEEDEPAPEKGESSPDSARTAMFQMPSFPKQGREVDPDVDAFADDAFGRLQAGEGAESPRRGTRPPPEPAPKREAARSAPPPRSTRSPASGADGAGRSAEDIAELERLRGELGATTGELTDAKGKAAEFEKRLALAQGEVERVRKAAEADAERLRTDAETETERLRRDLDELRSRPAPAPAAKGSVPPKPGAGVTSREFLDLRETLSKKDKEILALKQQLTAKDREIFEVRDRSLAHESRASELDDRVLAKDRELAEAAEKAEELTGQLDATNKALGDTRAALEQLEAEHDALGKKRDEENVTHEAAAAAMKADRAESERRLREEHAQAIAQAEASFKSQLAAAEAAHTAASEQSAAEHAGAIAEARAFFEQQEDAHKAANEQAATEHAAAIAEQRAIAERQEAASTAAREQAAREHATAMDQATREHIAATAQADAEHAASVEQAAGEHAAAMADLRAVAAREKADALATREAELKAETDAKLAALHRSQQEERERLRAEAAGRESALADQLAAANGRVDELEKEVASLSAARAGLEGELGAMTSRADALEQELGALRGELDGTRKDLVRESSRATRALAKWEADKASLERAKDALAVALSQLDEAEARPISD